MSIFKKALWTLFFVEIFAFASAKTLCGCKVVFGGQSIRCSGLDEGPAVLGCMLSAQILYNQCTSEASGSGQNCWLGRSDQYTRAVKCNSYAACIETKNQVASEALGCWGDCGGQGSQFWCTKDRGTIESC